MAIYENALFDSAELYSEFSSRYSLVAPFDLVTDNVNVYPHLTADPLRSNVRSYWYIFNEHADWSGENISIARNRWIDLNGENTAGFVEDYLRDMPNDVNESSTGPGQIKKKNDLLEVMANKPNLSNPHFMNGLLIHPIRTVGTNVPKGQGFYGENHLPPDTLAPFGIKKKQTLIFSTNTPSVVDILAPENLPFAQAQQQQLLLAHMVSAFLHPNVKSEPYEIQKLKQINLAGLTPFQVQQVVDVMFDQEELDKLIKQLSMFSESENMGLLSAPKLFFDNSYGEGKIPHNPPSVHGATETIGDDSDYKGFLDFKKTASSNSNANIAPYPLLKEAAREIFSNIENKKYIDFAFDMPLPLGALARKINSNLAIRYGHHGKGGGIADIKSVYNFFVRQYETGVPKNLSVTEHVLPNIYAFASEFDKGSKFDYTNLITLNGKIKQDVAQGMIKKNQNKNATPPVRTLQDLKIEADQAAEIKESNYSDRPSKHKPRYFEAFGQMAPHVTLEEAAEARNRFSHICIMPNNLDLLEKMKEYRTAFPMFTNISFDAASPGEFCHALHASKNTSNLLKTLILGMFFGKVHDDQAAQAGVTFPDESLNGYGITAHRSETAMDVMRIFEGAPGSAPKLPYFKDFPIRTAVEFDYPETIKSKFMSPTESQVSNINARVLDLQVWFDQIKDFGSSGEKAGLSSIFGNPQLTNLFNSYCAFFGDKKEPDMSPTSAFLQKLSQLIFFGKVKKMAKKHFRSYEDIIKGKKAYSETVFYRIEKKQPGPGGQVLQNIWIPNMPGHDVINYVDTQMKYNQTYEYSIFSYQIVFGSKYRYKFGYTDAQKDMLQFLNSANEQVDLENPSDTIKISNIGQPQHMYIFPSADRTGDDLKTPRFQQTMVDTITEPAIYITEVPVYHTYTHMVDNPPLPPNVNITPYVGIHNKIKLDLNTTTGDFDLDPIPVDPEDGNAFQIIRLGQKRTLANFQGNYIEPKLRFKTDDYDDFFEIYRLEKDVPPGGEDMDPINYSDFQGARMAMLDTRFTTSFVDQIVPNVKYYYMFRSRDVHGHISNPSDIYEIEMVKDGDVTFLKQRVVDLEDRNASSQRRLEKPMRRFMSIDPSGFQVAIKNEVLDAIAQSAYDVNIIKNGNIMGQVEESIFDENKRFKIRLTSRGTGRKIDLNLRFKTRYIDTVR